MFSSLILLFLCFLFLLICILFSWCYFTHLASCSRLPCFLPLSPLCAFPSAILCSYITIYELCLQSQDQVSEWLIRYNDMCDLTPADRLAKLIFLQMVKAHSFTEKQLLYVLTNKSVTCQCPGEYLLGVTNTRIKALANMILLRVWQYDVIPWIWSTVPEVCIGVFFVCQFLTIANMAFGFPVGGILNLYFFPLKRFRYEFIFFPPCLNHNIVLILVTPWSCYKSDRLISEFSYCFLPRGRKKLVSIWCSTKKILIPRIFITCNVFL